MTDRCDFRCVYCMAEDMTFLPKKDLLTLEELDRLCTAFVASGVRKLRLTGGEPLVRKNIMYLVRSLSPASGERRARRADADHQRLASSPRYAAELADCGVRRINVSLDTLDPRQVPRDHALGRARQGAWPASTRRRRPASRSRSTRWR